MDYEKTWIKVTGNCISTIAMRIWLTLLNEVLKLYPMLPIVQTSHQMTFDAVSDGKYRRK